MVTIALIVWAIFILGATFFGSIKLNRHEVRSIPGRFLTATFAVPFIGFIFWVFGFIGDFLLSPIFALFQ
jgi:hypothetical protein